MLMRIGREYLISHGWLLIPAAIIGVVAIVWGAIALSGIEQNGCSGFSYFGFIDHRADAGNYSIQLVNGANPVIITSVMVGPNIDRNPYSSLENVQPGNQFVIRTKPLSLNPGVPFTNTIVRITYDVINGEPNRTDSAICAGRVY